MDRVFLVRVPLFPQFNVLKDIHPLAPQVVSLLTFWMTENRDPSYCEVRHNYQVARHLCVELEDYIACLNDLKKLRLFDEHEIETRPANVEQNIARKTEIRLTLKLRRLQELLSNRNLKLPINLLCNASNDSFDFYDVIEEKHLPIEQKLFGTLSGKTYEEASFLSALFLLYLDKEHAELSINSIAEAWRILLPLPVDMNIFEYAKELNERFLRHGERAIDVNLTDGNIFIPDHDEIKSLVHIIRHYRKKADPMTVGCALFILLAALFPTCMSYRSALSFKDMEHAFRLVAKFCNWVKSQHSNLPLLESYKLINSFEEALFAVFTEEYFNDLEFSSQERTEFLTKLKKLTLK